jgi:hypothetical protein
LWRDDGIYGLDSDKILAEDALDVVHVQYQSMLFNQTSLSVLGRMLHSPRMTERTPTPYAITYHDNCQRPDFPYGAFDLHFTHRWNVGPPMAEVVPFGIEERPPIVRTFGLGRSRSDLIAPICEANGWVFESAATHEPIQGGGQTWRTHDALISWLRGADAIVLWYDDVGPAGSSQAARTAMAARRPVITNDTTWFSDLPNRAHGGSGPLYAQVGTPEALERYLTDLFERSYVEQNSWDHVAALLLERYERASVGPPAR